MVAMNTHKAIRTHIFSAGLMVRHDVFHTYLKSDGLCNLFLPHGVGPLGAWASMLLGRPDADCANRWPARMRKRGVEPLLHLQTGR